jgi:hypothetical protein
MSDKCQTKILEIAESLHTFAIKNARYEEIPIYNNVSLHRCDDLGIRS